ncbi:hypothetical protein B0H63DRAFT_565390 [Podospora didyma]|uniref:NACHT domain-containing protein n=1 Tax=Podospora didyma TaxID=330526 RepID=A0AAE0K360_9PEZI|nr:hypothetical protein B0H63DRAFT_565390 [Podospora didyma]
MPGLEAMVALGLVCNVFQVISFAKEVRYVSKSICESSEPPDATLVASLDVNLVNLNKVFAEVKTTIAAATRPLTSNDTELLEISKECTKAARALQAKVANTKIAAAKGNRVRVGSSIEQLEKLLKIHQKTLETRLLINICNKENAIMVQQQQDFNNINATLRQFIGALAEGETRMEVLLGREATSIKNHVTKTADTLQQTVVGQLASESKATRAEVSLAIRDIESGIVRSEVRGADKAIHDRLLQSLKYPTLNERRKQIVDPYAKTFQWVYGDLEGEPESDHNRGSSERRKRDAALIRGKAGSGKSTFIKFLVEDPRTKVHLAKSSKEALILSHFIWRAGQLIEGSIKGMLCSLLHQLLVAECSLTPILMDQFPNTTKKDTISDWSDKKLGEVIDYALRNTSRPLYLFIDGLDEIHESDGQFALLDVLEEELRHVPGLKICVSSRPEPVLKDLLSKYPMLQVHDLARQDIRNFTASILRKEFKQLSDATDEQLSKFINTVCDMADGVFLWVTLALRSLQSGLAKGDSLSDLERRLEALPPDLKNLYRAMWNRLGIDEEIYRQDAATYLNLVLIAGKLPNMASFLVLQNPLPILSVFFCDKCYLDLSVSMRRFWSRIFKLRESLQSA